MRHLTVICILLWSVAAVAAPTSAVATVQDVDTLASTATIQTTNTSQKDITGYVIKAVATYASGKTEGDEHSRDFGPRTTYEEFGLLRPGMSSQDLIHFTPRENDRLRHVDAQVVVVIYADQTAEVADERAFENHMSTRQAAAKSLQQSVDILRTSLSDPGGHPSGKAVELMKQAVLSGKASREPKNAGFLLEAQKYLEQAPEHAALASLSERDFVQQYLVAQEKKAASFAEYSNVQRLP